MGPGGFFPTNPDLANILGRTDIDFENFYFLDFLDLTFSGFQIPRFPNFQKSGLGQVWAGLGPGRAWARLGPWAGWAPRLGQGAPWVVGYPHSLRPDS